MAEQYDSRPVHTHPCGHDCQCREQDDARCDRCEIADVILRRHHLTDMSRGRALAALYLAIKQGLILMQAFEGGHG